MSVGALVRRKRALLLTLVAAGDVALPVVMGVCEVGSRRGPVFYPEWLHEALFLPACEMANGYKPRRGVVELLYDRALFYGLAERPKREKERTEVLQRLRAQQSPLVPLLEAEECRIQTGQRQELGREVLRSSGREPPPCLCGRVARGGSERTLCQKLRRAPFIRLSGGSVKELFEDPANNYANSKIDIGGFK